MDIHYFESIEETLIYHRLANGLQVYIVPKRHHHTIHGVMSIDFGSVHRHLRHSNQDVERIVPAGAAHFLEHKLFEDVRGNDISQVFAAQGAMVNAFTSHTQTNYMFSSPVNVEDNLLTLMHFVQQMHFTPESIEREKGIIQQELFMYEDDPYAKGYRHLIQNLYPNHPISEDILGTVESIETMTFEDLQVCFQTFYQPNKMRLIIVGNVEAQEIIEMLEQRQSLPNQMLDEWVPVVPTTWEEPIDQETLYLDVSQPIAMLGVRLLKLDTTASPLENDWLLDIMAELLFGPTSNNYAQWYQAQLVDTSFVINTVSTPFMHHLTLESSTHSPKELLEVWQQVLIDWRKQPDMNKEHFEALIRGRIGDVLRELDNLEEIASELAESLSYGASYFQGLDFLQRLSYADIVAYAEKYLANISVSLVTILPLNEQKG